MLVLFLQALTALHFVGLVGIIAMLQMDRFDDLRRNLAVGMLVLFATGTGLVFLLEQIQPFIWENAPVVAGKKGGGGGGQEDASGPSGGGKKERGEGGGQPAAEGNEAEVAGGESGEGSAASRSKPRGVLQDCEDCPEMVPVSGGTFALGATSGEDGAQANELPRIEGVKLSSFAIGRFEITRAQYAAFVKATKHPLTASCGGANGRGTGITAAKPGFATNVWQPMVCVTWLDAQTYAAWLGKITGKAYRLPTAAEWEYAARAGNAYPYQNGTPKIGDQEARFGLTAAVVGPTAVGSFGSNKRGLFDMHGNAAEWVEDCATQSLKGTPLAEFKGQIPPAPGCDRVVKGGGWFSPAQDLRFAARPGLAPATASNGIGFRIARDLE